MDTFLRLELNPIRRCSDEKKRRKFTNEFKEEAVKLVLEEGYPISEAARNLGIHANLLGRWKREYEDGGKDGSDPEVL